MHKDVRRTTSFDIFLSERQAQAVARSTAALSCSESQGQLLTVTILLVLLGSPSR